MTPEERQLIAGLFDRMRSYGAPDKDREAEALINQSVRANPDAPYMLVQSVLVQEQALQAANDRVTQLEDELRELRGDARAPARSGGFLGGVWGGGRRRGAEVERADRSARARRLRPGASRLRSSSSLRRPSSSPRRRRWRLHEVRAGDGRGRGGRHAARRQHPQHDEAAARTPAPLATETNAKYVDERDNDPGTYDASNDPGFDSDAGGGDIEI